MVAPLAAALSPCPRSVVVCCLGLAQPHEPGRMCSRRIEQVPIAPSDGLQPRSGGRVEAADVPNLNVRHARGGERAGELGGGVAACVPACTRL